MSAILAVSSLLLSGALLHVSGGLQGLLVPIRAQAEGFDVSSISLMGSTYAIGFLLGCIVAPRMIGRAGHARAYTVVAAIAGFAVGWVGLWIDEWAWIVLRSLTGFAFAAAATIAESWLNERADSSNRGTFFGYYTACNFAGLTLGQLLLTLMDPSQAEPFILASMLFAAALIPTAMTRCAQPAEQPTPRWPSFKLALKSPVGSLAIFIIGLGSSAFGTLAPVYASEVGLSLNETAWFMTVSLIAGALFQIPVGRLSDKRDRRRVLGGLSLASAMMGLAFVVFQTPNLSVQLIMAAGMGATLYTLYGVSIALVNDQIGPGNNLEVAGLMLILFGLGAVIGPIACLPIKAAMGPAGLFGFILIIHLVLAAVIAFRIRTARISPLPVTEYSIQRPGSVSSLSGEMASPESASHSHQHTGDRQ